MACVVTIFISPAEKGDSANFMTLIPLTLLGIGYSVYAAALWGCIPYTVPPRLVGTAYGLCTAVQNVGLTISPLIAAATQHTKKQDGYFWLMIYFSALSCIGIVFNVWLYIDDLRNRGGILDAVDKGETSLENLMTTPTQESKRREAQKHFDSPNEDDVEMNVDE